MKAPPGTILSPCAGPPWGLRQTRYRIAWPGGESADVVILDATALYALIVDGLVDVHSTANLATSGIGFAVAPSYGPVHIDTVDALRNALLQAKCIAVSASGSGRYVSGELLGQLGIADRVKDRLMVSPKTPVSELLADGQCDAGFQQVSELAGARGISFVGPLPAAVQKTTVFAAGIPINALHPEAGAALIRELTAPMLRAVGLEPPAR